MDGLVEHGIMNENSDYRVHIGVVAETAFVLETATVQRVIRENRYQIVQAMQDGVDGITSEGWLVPLCAFWPINEIDVSDLSEMSVFSKPIPLDERGAAAEDVFRKLCEKRGKSAQRVTNLATQISGGDFIVAGKIVQVKCDWAAGEWNVGRVLHGRFQSCTGNFYFEKAERNPLRRYS
jgi:hypothetical protein